MYFIFSVPHMVLLLCFYPCAFERSPSLPTVLESGLAESTGCIFFIKNVVIKFCTRLLDSLV